MLYLLGAVILLGPIVLPALWIYLGIKYQIWLVSKGVAKGLKDNKR